MTQFIQDLTKSGSLKIYQIPDIATFTFDAVLLANFVKITKDTKRIVDLCSGNGAVSLLMTEKISDDKIEIIQVEVQSLISDLAVKSIALNQLDHQIKVVNQNLIGINQLIGNQVFNLVVCNPPYFKYSATANVRLNEAAKIARHEVLVTFEQIVKEVNLLVNNKGYFTFVHRPERLEDIIVALSQSNFHIKRLQFVYPKAGQNANTVLIEARKGGAAGSITILPPLVVYKANNQYTTAAKKIIYRD